MGLVLDGKTLANNSASLIPRHINPSIATLPYNHLSNITNMQFFTLFATIVAASTTFAVAAPTDDGYSQPNKTDCGKCGDYGNNNKTNNGQWDQKPRVGHSLDLWPNTPLSSLACSATFNKMYPRALTCPLKLRYKFLTLIFTFTEFHTLGDLPTAPFYGGAPDTGSCTPLLQ